MLLPDWMTSTLSVIPALAWVYLGVGLPWALALLPRRDWSRRMLVVGLGWALGPLLLTAWMLVLGMMANLYLEPILAGTVILAGLGWGLSWRKRRTNGEPIPASRSSLHIDEKLLIGLIVIAVGLRWIAIAFWPFTAYDALWVFGYEGRLYTLLHAIPDTIDYYPQFMPLQYTFAQLIVGGVDDHAARAVIGFTHIGSILAAYMLGSRLFTRRAGIFAAAIWALYPHVGEWARFGDLEIPLTFLFTAAAAFFLLAWTDTEHRRRYALIAGLLLGGALWTKPTAGAFIWGVLLLLGLDLVRVRFNWRAWRPRFEVAVITGLASIPLGAVWYLRNIALGHNVIDFPPAFWLTQAARSGSEFGWLLLALLVLLGYLFSSPDRPDPRRVLIGLVLVLLGLLPSILFPHRMNLVEWGLLIAGSLVLYRPLKASLLSIATATLAPEPDRSSSRHDIARMGWALALALPYFVTWFYSYSYHYRLSFAIVPLLILPTAVVLSWWFPAERLRSWTRVPRFASITLIVLLAVPGTISWFYDAATSWDWLWDEELRTDIDKYTVGNSALMWVVDGLQKYIDENPDELLVVAAPGVDRLPFFFPLVDIRVDETPTRWEELADVTYFIDSFPEGRGAYEDIPLLENQILSGLSLAESTVANIVRKAWWQDDGTFNYVVYELHLDKRFDNPATIHDPVEPVVFGDVVRFRGHGIGADTFWPSRPIYLQLYWEALATPAQDYMIYVHLRDSAGTVVANWDGPVTHSQDGRYYSTLLWDPGEFVRDERLLKFSSDTLPPVGEDYTLHIGMYDLETGVRLPVTRGEEFIGDGYQLNERFKVVAEQP